MCFVDTPKTPKIQPPAAAPPPPEESAAVAQASPVNDALEKKKMGSTKKNKLRIDLKESAVSSPSRFSIYAKKGF